MEADTCLCDAAGVDDPCCPLDAETVALGPAEEEEEEEEEEEDRLEGYTCIEEEDDLEDPERLLECHKDNKHGWRRLVTSRYSSICLYLTVVLLLLSSTVSVLVVGLIVAAPYHKASSFLPRLCSPVRTERDPQDSRCSCGQDCRSQHACVRLLVRVVRSGSALGHGQWTAVLAEDETKLSRKCSFYPACSSIHAENHAVVDRYIQQYGVSGLNYSCLYDPGHVTHVIRGRRFTSGHVIHGLLWPTVVLCGSALSLVVMLRRKGCGFL